MAIKLLLKFNMAVIKEIPITDDKTSVSVGRKEDNDIVIDNPAVSGHHAKIMKIGNTYFVEDLSSTNGTFIKGQKILKAEVHNNDQIDIAKHSIVFVNDEEASQAPPPPVKENISSDQTVVMDFSKQKAILEQQAQQQGQVASPQLTNVGCVKVIDGIVDKTEIELSSLNSYVGTAETAVIKITGGGLFGKLPRLAAVINRRPTGEYVLKALEAGYPRVNNQPVNDVIELKDGDIIEAGKTRAVFFWKEKK